MSFIPKLFGGGEPAPIAPLPIAPTAPDNAAAQKARDEAASAASAEQRANGRRATIAGGARGILESRQADQARKTLG